MKIILTSTVNKVGKIGDVVEVKSGYAKNFLIPTNKAICYNKNNYKIFEAKKDFFEKANQANLDSANQIKNNLSGKKIIIIESSSDDGRLYGSVTATILVDRINSEIKDKPLARNSIALDKPIKEVGLYNITVKPFADVQFNVKIVIARNESEAEDLIKSEKEEIKE
jgi:large subunit ribosomal protein L9